MVVGHLDVIPFFVQICVSTNTLPCTDFLACLPSRVVRAAFLLILPHLGRRPNLVARLLVNLGFCRMRFWYPVAPGSGISRETSRISFCSLTLIL